MNTIMKGCAECRFCGKTIRFMEVTFYRGTPGIEEHGYVSVDAESTAPEDTKFDEKRHTKHKPRCKGQQGITVTYASGMSLTLKKKPCGCKEKKNA